MTTNIPSWIWPKMWYFGFTLVWMVCSRSTHPVTIMIIHITLDFRDKEKWFWSRLLGTNTPKQGLIQAELLLYNNWSYFPYIFGHISQTKYHNTLSNCTVSVASCLVLNDPLLHVRWEIGVQKFGCGWIKYTSSLSFVGNNPSVSTILLSYNCKNFF